MVAFDTSDLIDCGNPRCLDRQIDRTEEGTMVTPAVDVWTGTRPEGIAHASCDFWTLGNASSGAYGSSGTTTENWTQAGILACQALNHLYCFQD